MAKLKAHKVIAKLRKDVDTPDDDLIAKRSYVRAICEDKKLLQCYKVLWREDMFHKCQQWHSYGYKVKGKLKPEVTPEQHIEHLKEKGWYVV